MTEAYNLLFTVVLAVLGVLLFLCLLRAILGPRIADRVVGINMIGTIVIMMIAILALMLGEGYTAADYNHGNPYSCYLRYAGQCALQELLCSLPLCCLLNELKILCIIFGEKTIHIRDLACLLICIKLFSKQLSFFVKPHLSQQIPGTVLDVSHWLYLLMIRKHDPSSPFLRPFCARAAWHGSMLYGLRLQMYTAGLPFLKTPSHQYAAFE